VGMDRSERIYLEIDVLGLIVWTWHWQDPSLKEEQETWISLSMDPGKQNMRVLLIGVSE
jgi:hypothetical protein